MSTMKRRIPMFLLALAMMVAMALPTFADGFTNQSSVCAEMLTDFEESNRIVARGANPPSSRNVWDWSRGNYTGSISMKHCVYTNYVFTGYSSYDISAYLSCDNKYNNTISIVAYDQYGNVQGRTDERSKMNAELHLSGLSAATKIYVAVIHDNDGFTATGEVTVAHG